VIGILSMNKSGSEQAEIQRIEDLLESQYEQFKLKKESSERIMTKCHDLQKQLRLFETTNQPEYIEKYREELQKTIQDYDSVYETGNATIDTMLSEAALKCRRQGGQLICLLDGRDFAFISPMDLCTIFGNALDNAVESVERIARPEKRIIHVKSLEESGYLFLRFDNYYEHELRWEDGELLTGKAEKEGHGYGLKSIRFAAEKYEGRVTSQAKDGRFVLTIAFPARPDAGGARK
jgi:sensor histidine kinase regulating citrate/malate metabolism